MAYKYPFSIQAGVYYHQLAYNRYNNPFDYTPPVGGYVNNDETEWDNTTWNDTIHPKFTWGEVSGEFSHDLGYEQLVLRPLYETPTLFADLQNGKSNKADFEALDDVAAHGISSATTDAATDAPTDLDPITTLLGTLTQELNYSNERLNAAADKYNDLATKFNALLGKVTLMEDAINNLKAAGAGE
jgi:hypothetical protein